MRAASRFSILFLAGMAVLIFLAYAVAVQSAFKTDDDRVVIVTNEHLRSVKGLGAIVSGSIFGDNAYYRPLVGLSHFIEFQMFGLNAIPYYWFNIFLHAVNAIFAFFIFKRILSDDILAQWAAFFYAIHPVHWEAVSNIAGRPILLSALFGLAAFAAFLKSLNEERRLWINSSYVFTGLALLCKESAVMIPFVITVYVFLNAAGEQRRRLALKVGGYFFILGAYFFLRSFLEMTHTYHWRNPTEFALGVATFFKSVLLYGRILLFPVDLHFDRSIAILAPGQMAEASFLVAVAALVAGALYGLRRRVAAVEMFLIIWFFIELIPVSSTLVLIGIQPGYVSAAEHFLYLPAVSGAALIIIWGRRLMAYVKSKGWVSVSLARFIVVCAGSFYFLTLITMNVYARSEEAMYERTLQFAPHNIRIHRALGVLLAQKGEFARAQKHFDAVCRLNPDDVFARISLGKALIDQGFYEAGLAEYKKVKDAGVYQPLLNNNILATEQLMKNLPHL